jgi:hypothetical protein
MCHYRIQSTLLAGGYTTCFQEINLTYIRFKICGCQFQCNHHYFLDCIYSFFGASTYSERKSFYLTLVILNMRSRLCHLKNEHTPCIVVCGTAHWLLYYYTMAIQLLYGGDNISPLTLISPEHMSFDRITLNKMSFHLVRNFLVISKINYSELI